MKVTFGLRLDERQGPSDGAFFLAPVVGRMGFLALLETYLGLARPEVPKAQRVAAYLGHLRNLDNGSRFYSASLAADDVGTAAHLLAWRDEWRLGGWLGDASQTSPRRLQELAAVEATASGNIAPGEGERLAEVCKALDSGKVPVDEVQLVDPLELFPWAWRQVLKKLPCVAPPSLEPRGIGALAALQTIARDSVAAGKVATKLDALNDGTVCIFQAQSRETAEHWLSAWCRANPVNRVVLCEDGGDSLDATLVATGAAACGFERPSELRPALQVLGLAVELCWTPLDIGRLVDFLVHPLGPFSRHARNLLARAVAEQPGLGSDAWQDARATIAAMENGDAILEEVAFWLEGERWTRTAGVPLDAIAARADKVFKVLQRRAQKEDPAAAAIGPALHQCSAVLESLAELKRQGLERLLPRQIEQLIAQSTPHGAINPGAIPHVGCWKSATSAAACVEPADEVIWWMPSTPALPQPLPWSAAEVEGLHALGVELRNPSLEIKALAEQWLRPLFAATKHFVLVLPPPGAEEHPIWQLIKQIAPSATVIQIDQELYRTDHRNLAQPVDDLQLAHAERYIDLGRPLVTQKSRQSYSSLNDFFNNPALAALKDAARLRPGIALSAEEGNRLLGTLGHRVIENLFQNDGALGWSDETAQAWFASTIDSLLEAEGAPLLMQGAGVTMHRFKKTCLAAICSLLGHLRSAGAVRVQTEVSIDGQLGDVPLTGKIDLLVELPPGRFVALDLKWTRTKAYGDLLVKGKHLQLALYASLVRERYGQSPVATGYFIFDSDTLFVTAPDIFPNANVRQPKSGITIEQLLTQAVASWQWRTNQWEQGIIELVDERLDDIDEFQGPEGTLPVEPLGPWNAEYLALLGGWEQ